MAYKSPLVNPTPARFLEKEEVEQEEAIAYIPPKDQLKMEIDTPTDKAKQYISSFSDRMKSRGDITKHSPLFNTQAFAFLVVSFLSNIIIMLSTGFFRFDTLPQNIPFFFISTENSWVQIDKSFVFFIPLLLLVFFIIQLRFLSYIFTKDRRLTMVLLWINALLNILLTISAVQIYNLVT